MLVVENMKHCRFAVYLFIILSVCHCEVLYFMYFYSPLTQPSYCFMFLSLHCMLYVLCSFMQNKLMIVA